MIPHRQVQQAFDEPQVQISSENTLGPIMDDPKTCGFVMDLGLSGADIARFWRKVAVSGDDTCWLWTGSVNGSGSVQHGQFTTSRRLGPQRSLKAHRIAYRLLVGPIPPGQVVCHHCDEPRCCNPRHLFLGTQADNLDDARQKGRLIDGLQLCKLSLDDIATIRREYRPRHNGRALAHRFGISLTHLMRVVRGFTPSSLLVAERFNRIHASESTQAQSAMHRNAVDMGAN